MVTLYLQFGKVISALFFGAQGNPKKQKPQLLEIGQVINLVLQKNKFHADFLVPKEWNVEWQHESLRHHYASYYMLNAMSEVLISLVPTTHMDEVWKLSDVQFSNKSVEYQVYVKFVICLESLSHSQKSHQQELKIFWILFLGKMMRLQGVFPRFQTCSQCQTNLELENVAKFSNGFFICRICEAVPESAAQYLWQYCSWSYALKMEQFLAEFSGAAFLENIILIQNNAFELLNISEDKKKKILGLLL